MKSKAAIFLNGTYSKQHDKFYMNEYRLRAAESLVIATDGGLRWLADHNLEADIIIGDIDSVEDERLKSYPPDKIIKISTENKSFTDGELALRWCVDNKFVEAVLYGGIDTAFETDHLLGNIFMMFRYLDKIPSIKMRDFSQEIVPLKDCDYAGGGKVGDLISVVPLSREIVYRAEGLKYDPQGRKFSFGQSTPLRNELAADKFRIEIEGRAVLIKHF